MLTLFTRFIDWFLMKEGENHAQNLDPSQLLEHISDVSVLFAELEGKFANEEARNALINSIIAPLNEKPGISVRPLKKSFAPLKTGSLSERFENVQKEGRKTLEGEKADLLIWGTVVLEEQAVRLYYLSLIDGAADLGCPGIAESILIPFETDPLIINVLYAGIFASCHASHPSHASKIAEHLINACDPLTKLPTGLNPRKTSQNIRASVMGMCSIILSNMARRGEGLGWFEPAVNAFSQWETLIEKDKNLIDWALTTNHRGWLYETMAAHDDDTERNEHLDLSFRYFNDISDIFQATRNPLEWASVQLRIAQSYAKFGRKLNEPDLLQKAARFYKRSLDVYTQQKYPLNWADIMTRLAKTMMLHGQMVKGAQSLEQAGVAFQAALKVYTPEKYPALWASTQNNLGATLFALAKRDPQTEAWLTHALGCFQEARGYYHEINRMQMVHVIDKNIARAEALKDQYEKDKENLFL